MRSLSREALLDAYRSLFLDQTRTLVLVAVPDRLQGQWQPSGARAVLGRAELLRTNTLFPAEAEGSRGENVQ